MLGKVLGHWREFIDISDLDESPVQSVVGGKWISVGVVELWTVGTLNRPRGSVLKVEEFIYQVPGEGSIIIIKTGMLVPRTYSVIEISIKRINKISMDQ